MTDLHADIIKWLYKQQDWLQEAAERLLDKGSLDDDSLKDIAERLKSSDGQNVTKHRKFMGLAGTSSAAEEIRLESIANVQSIENLSPRKPLRFGAGNLTVIYGHNGSGKSSYTRILKKACGKPRSVDLQPNVFQDPPGSRSCAITYSVDSVSRTEEWRANSDPIVDLLTVDIFDGATAGFYLSDESEVSYIPSAVELLKELARTCDRLRDELQYEESKLVSKLPVLPQEFSDTPIAKAYQGLTAEQTDNDLKLLLGWTEEDEKVLDRLAERLKSTDPAKLAREKRSLQIQIQKIIDALNAATKALGAAGCKKIKELNKVANDKRQQATEAATVSTKSAELKGIGTDTWVQLWEAAREYSFNHAYQGQTYPVTDDDSRCVLCHQKLDDVAKQRLQDFEKYVQGKIEAAAREAEEAYCRAIKNIPSARSEDEIRTQCKAASLEDDSMYAQLCVFWRKYKQVHDQIASSRPDLDGHGIEEPTQLVNDLKRLVQSLERQAIQHDADAQNVDREKVLQDKRKLEARRWVSQQAESIRAEVRRLRSVKQLQNLKKLTHTRKISSKADDVSQKAITDAYVHRFNQELKTLGAGHIKIELVKTRIERGKVKHRIRLKGLKKGDVTPDSVLSDGERRVVALAAFLADVTGKPYSAPFVFDDPISSLDHDFEWEVAMRLARLANDRQVIVLTHRLSLYGATEDAARKVGEEWKKNNLTQLYIESFAGTAGHPADEAVWNTNTKKANNILINRLDDAKKYWDAGDSNTYRVHAQAVCTDFRKLLERTIEEDLLNQIVKRHRRSVTTDNRIGHLAKISDSDCQFFDELMTKYSCYEHSQSDEAPSFLPEEPELRRDVQALKQWREEFTKRAAEEVSA